MLTIEIKGHKELMQKLNKLKMKSPAKRVCKELAGEMVMGMKSRAPFWLGNLSKSIQSRQTSDGYNIHTLAYGIYQETGTKPHWVGEDSALRIWAADKSWDWSRLQRRIAFRGTHAHPFIQPSIDSTMDNFAGIASFSVKNTLKECGFNER